jgi:transmembrane sensor
MKPGDELPERQREQWDVDAMWSRVRARAVDAPDEPADRAPLRGAARTGPGWVGRVAAAASLLIIVGSGTLIVRARLASRASAVATTAGQYSTSRGQYATIRLTDGSEVTLAPESHLTISGKFAQDAREMTLDGEAIFSVRHDAAHPFRVRARGALIEDVGTRFDLRAYPDDAGVTVAVVEGSVSLGGATSPSPRVPARRAAIVLKAGDIGTIDGDGNPESVKDGQASTYLDWANGKLSFVDRPLPDVLRTIARWYDLDIRVTDRRLSRRLVTAGFSRQSSSDVLNALAIALDATVERNGRAITLRPR